MAGYPDEMEELISSNPGLRSRFPKVIHFPDYTTDELLAIIDTLGEKGGYRLDPGARARGPDLARLDHPRQGLRQRPHRPQPVRARGVDAGHAARARRLAHRRAAHRRSSPTTSPRPARGRSPSSDRPVRSDRAAGAGGPRGGGHGGGGRADPPGASTTTTTASGRRGDGDRRRRVRRPTSPTQCEALGDDVEVRTEAAADDRRRPRRRHASPRTSTRGSPRTAWLEVVDSRSARRPRRRPRPSPPPPPSSPPLRAGTTPSPTCAPATTCGSASATTAGTDWADLGDGSQRRVAGAEGRAHRPRPRRSGCRSSRRRRPGSSAPPTSRPTTRASASSRPGWRTWPSRRPRATRTRP